MKHIFAHSYSAILELGECKTLNDPRKGPAILLYYGPALMQKASTVSEKTQRILENSAQILRYLMLSVYVLLKVHFKLRQERQIRTTRCVS